MIRCKSIGYAFKAEQIPQIFGLKSTEPRSNTPEAPPSAEMFRSVFDRVPYTMDFGILLADYNLWSKLVDEKLASGKKVGDIWRTLARPLSGIRGVVSWRETFEACKIIAEKNASIPGRIMPFDVDLSTVESFSCMVLEVWASELFSSHPHIFPRRRDYRPGSGFLQLIRGEGTLIRRALYRARLLLNSVLDPLRFKRDRFRIRPGADPIRAAASRHWYSTASGVVTEDESSGGPLWTPLRLPGHFTIRGDWFLGVAHGSRSRRLGERAIDLLTSRRANITRMQMGVGLPVRGLPTKLDQNGDWIDAEFRSPFFGEDAEGHRRRLRLHDLLRLGRRPSLPHIFNENQDYCFYWLWRSGLQDYDRHSRIWSKWLIYVLDEMRSISSLTADPDATLALYDELASHAEATDEPLFRRFDALCNDLEEALGRSTIWPISR